MLQGMLRERFHVQVHREQRESSGYALRADPKNLRLKAAATAPDSAGIQPDMSVKQDDKGNTSITIPGVGTTRSSPIEGNPMLGTHLQMPAITTKALASIVSRYIGHPVIDETGLDGSYSLALDVSMADILRAGGRPLPASLKDNGGEDNGGPDILSSLKKQGLILVPRKVPVTVLIVDHLDRTPTEN
jgi:uncharacterized protein (TIGR03435 family)